MTDKTVTLVEKSGRIWPNKPVVSSGGLISVLWHSPVRLSQFLSLLFAAVQSVFFLISLPF